MTESTCSHCGKPVYTKCWYSAALRHCFIRAMGQDCAPEKRKKDGVRHDH